MLGFIVACRANVRRCFLSLQAPGVWTLDSRPQASKLLHALKSMMSREKLFSRTDQSGICCPVISQQIVISCRARLDFVADNYQFWPELRLASHSRRQRRGRTRQRLDWTM